ncbi:MAG: acyl-homoserine-lactone synthase [Parvularcula sp.]|jgi:N-acyl-L-homoserine lactone synthetase|nr:acyl-homoserine-lactone synthase [Parvularcula sp.]
MSFDSLPEHGQLFVSYLQARKRTFIDANRWDLLQSGGMEYDQYDTPCSRWIVLHDDGEIKAGLRLTPTTARCGIYTYMLRDAQLGLLKGIPPNILNFEAPIAKGTWEASRIFVVTDVPGRERITVHRQLMSAMVEVCRDLNISRVYGLVPAVWQRWIAPLGIKAEPAGPILKIDGLPYQVAEMKLRKGAQFKDLGERNPPDIFDTAAE